MLSMGWEGRLKKRAKAKQSGAFDSLPYLERGCPHQPGVQSHEWEFGSPAWLGGGDQANPISRPGSVPRDGDRLRGGWGAAWRRARAGQSELSASPAGAEGDKVKTPCGPRENPPAGAREMGSEPGKNRPCAKTDQPLCDYLSRFHRCHRTSGDGGVSILKPKADRPVPRDGHHMLRDITEAPHSPLLTEVILTSGQLKDHVP